MVVEDGVPSLGGIYWQSTRGPGIKAILARNRTAIGEAEAEAHVIFHLPQQPSDLLQLLTFFVLQLHCSQLLG